MKKILGLVFGGVVVAGATGWGQTHKVAAPENVVRAVGVYEWTGDLTKPKASRLIPVSLFIEGHIEDAGVYIARPVPFALLSGNVYELQDAGITKGTLELSYARHMQAVDQATGDAAYDDGWFGYGVFHAPVTAKRAPSTLRASKNTPVIASSGSDSGKPHFSNKSGDATTPASSGGDSTTTKTDSSASTADPDRPTMKRRSDSDSSAGSAATQSAGDVPADDPDRPTMKRRTSDSGSDTSGSSTTTQASGSTPADDPDRPSMKKRSPDASDTTTTSDSTSGGGDPTNDPDRPTLKRRSPEEAKKQRAKEDDMASVSAVGSLNDDPNRPNLHRGKPASAMTEADLPKLNGLPQDLHQMVAVSDAKNRDPHEFARPWEDAAEKAAVLTKLQAMARAQLAAYGSSKPAASTAATKNPSTASKTASVSRTHRTAASASATPTALLDEQLNGYTLSYGGAATYVYTAHTAGTGADLRYVAVVAQADALGELKPAMQSVTDAAHLDRTPWMRFVDVVDVEASNRASMLFELRGQNARQFALYRVIADRPEQIFMTGTTQ